MVMKKLAIIFAAGLLFINAGCSSANKGELSTWVRLNAALHARFTNGKMALKQASDAKAAAKSYKMRVEMRLHPGDPFITVEEVSCPDKQRMSASLGDRAMYEAVRVGSISYVKDEKERWVKSPIPPDVFPCGNNPGAPVPWAILNEGRDMSSALTQLATKARANVAVGKLIVVDGSPCQEWEVSFGHPGSNKPGGAGMGDMRYTICIDTQTHLPAQVVMGSGGIIMKYYDWNQPVNITAPM